MMPDSTLAQIVTAVTSIGTMVALVLGAIAALITARKIGRKVDQVHTLVNQQHTDNLNYQAALIRALDAHGIDVPIDQSAPQPQADR